jgi:hypothetical protein
MIALLRSIENEAAERPIHVHHVDTQSVRSALGGAKNKERAAAIVVEAFPSLKWKRPPTREHKPWVSEGWNMAVLDAVAVGLAYMKCASSEADADFF